MGQSLIRGDMNLGRDRLRPNLPELEHLAVVLLQETNGILGIIEALTDKTTTARGRPETSASVLLLRLLLDLNPGRSLDNGLRRTRGARRTSAGAGAGAGSGLGSASVGIFQTVDDTREHLHPAVHLALRVGEHKEDALRRADSEAKLPLLVLTLDERLTGELNDTSQIGILQRKPCEHRATRVNRATARTRGKRRGREDTPPALHDSSAKEKWLAT